MVVINSEFLSWLSIDIFVPIYMYISIQTMLYVTMFSDFPD